jgi:hypothetical protein
MPAIGESTTIALGYAKVSANRGVEARGGGSEHGETHLIRWMKQATSHIVS